MANFSRPVVIISKCLTFEKCRYNAQVIPDAFIERMKAHVEFRPVCPEVEIGLGVPREPIRIVYNEDEFHLYQPATEKMWTEEMKSFTDAYLGSLETYDGFILKSRSPSCGVVGVKAYHGFEKSASGFKTPGFFGGAVMERFNDSPIEDEGRLRNFTIREHFLTSIFTLARFREISSGGRLSALQEFHAENKFLLMAVNQTKMREMGRVVANHEKLPLTEVFEKYGELLRLAFTNPPRFTSHINVLEHALGGFKNELTTEEKKFFLNSIEEYRDERIPLSALIYTLKSWAIRFNKDYLLKQSYLSPYPKDLTDITDSGKGRPL